MTEVVIVSTARAPFGRAYQGSLNSTEGAPLLGHAISATVSCAKLDNAEVEDVAVGRALQQGTTGTNIARKALLWAGLPVGRRRKAKYAVVTKYIGGGMGAAGLLEIVH
jgi:acetyl-CoA C-acetyltransferase/acetyl-CoA acyltransferase